MCRIAICDDVKVELEHIKELVTKISLLNRKQVKIHLFSEGKSVIERLNKNKNCFDILLLDVDMPDISGLEVAKALREKGSEIILIFVSAHEEFVFESIEFSPFRYIRKNRIDIELPPALSASFSVLSLKTQKLISLKGEGETAIVKHSDIMYAEVSGHHLLIKTSTGKTYKTRQTLKSFSDELDDTDFVKIHSGCLINAKYISKYSSFDITLENGERLIVSRSCLKSIKQALMNYWGTRI